MVNLDLYPLILSIKVATLATLLTICVGVPTGYALARCKFVGKKLVDSLFTLPMVLPPTVLGFYLLVVIGRQSPLGRFLEDNFGLNLVFTWQAAVLAAFLTSFPLLVKSAKAAFAAIDINIENAARTLGRSETAIFFFITIPLAWKAHKPVPAIIVTHDLNEAYSLSSWMVVIEGGKVIQSGDKQKVLARPANKTSARLTRAKNIFTGTVTRIREGKVCLQAGLYVFTAICNVDLAIGQEVNFMIRPHLIRLLGDEKQGSEVENIFNGRVVSVINHIDSHTITLRLEKETGAESTCFVKIDDFSYEKLKPRVDGHVGCYFPPEKIVVMK